MFRREDEEELFEPETEAYLAVATRSSLDDFFFLVASCEAEARKPDHVPRRGERPVVLKLQGIAGSQVEAGWTNWDWTPDGRSEPWPGKGPRPRAWRAGPVPLGLARFPGGGRKAFREKRAGRKRLRGGTRDPGLE